MYLRVSRVGGFYLGFVLKGRLTFLFKQPLTTRRLLFMLAEEPFAHCLVFESVVE